MVLLAAVVSVEAVDSVDSAVKETAGVVTNKPVEEVEWAGATAVMTIARAVAAIVVVAVVIRDREVAEVERVSRVEAVVAGGRGSEALQHPYSRRSGQAEEAMVVVGEVEGVEEVAAGEGAQDSLFRCTPGRLNR